MANTLLKDVEQIFAEALQDPQLNPPGFDGHEGFISRVNAIGLELMRQRDYCLAAQVYRQCIGDALEFRARHGVRRHLGTLYANLAIACLCHGSIDEGICHFQKAADEDFKTASIDPEASYANVLVKDFADHIIKMFADILVGHRLGITQTDVEDLFKNLPRNYYFALLAYSHSFVYSYQYLQDLGGTPWFYTYNQMISALRNMTALFEDMQRSYFLSIVPPRDIPRGLDSLLTERFGPSSSGGAAAWWGPFGSHKGPLNRALPTSGFVATIQAIDALPRANQDDDIAGSVLLTYFTRNHLGHQLTQSNEIDLPLAVNLLGSLVHALIHAR